MFFLNKKNKNKINTKDRNEIEVEEIFLDKYSSEQGDGDNYLDRKLEYPLYPKILEAILIAAFLIFILIIGYSAYLTMLKNEYYSGRAEKNISKTIFSKAPRGLIFDRFGEKLVENTPLFDAMVVLNELPRDYKERISVLEKAKLILGLEPEYLNNLISKADFENQKIITIKENILHEEALALESKNLAGIKSITRNYRKYKDGPVFSHIIGYIGREENWREVGRDGIESYYDFWLSGEEGEKKLIKQETTSTFEEISVKEAVIGKNLTLTVDAGLQRFSYNTLQYALAELGSDAGMVVALDPRNGEILALVSWPSYDNNLFSRGLNQEEFEKLKNDRYKSLFNRAVSGLYSPASTIKPLIALAALEEKIISPTETIDDSKGFIEVPNPYFPDKPTILKDWKIHGPNVDIKKAIAESCDVYFYTIGGGLSNIKGLGIDKIKKYLDNFNLGSLLGVDLPGEEAGLLPDPALKAKNGDFWRIGDTYNISIGQGEFLTTPLQIAAYIGAIAQDGILYQPHFLKAESRTESDNWLSGAREKSPAILKNNSFAQNNLKIIQAGMRMAVASSLGTAYILGDLPIKVAAKSGTAEVIKGEKINSFLAAYAPYDNPEIVLFIGIEGAPEGILSATPIARDILYWYWENRIANNREFTTNFRE